MHRLLSRIKGQAGRHPAWAGLFALEAAILLFAMGAMFRPLYAARLPASALTEPYDYDGALELTTDSRGMLCLAGGQAETFAEMKRTAGPLGVAVTEISLGERLPAGLYELRVVWQADAEGVTPPATVQLEAAGGNAVGYSVPLRGAGETCERVWLLTDNEQPLLRLYSQTETIAIESMELCETGGWRLLQWLGKLLFFIGADLLLLLMVPGTRFARPAAERAGLLCFFLCVMLVSLPALNNYISYGFDLEFHLSRIGGIAEGLKAGQFPVRIYPDSLYGYGYASPVFYGDIFLYFPAVLYLLGCPLYQAYNLYIIAVNAACYAVSWFCFKRMFRSNLCAAAGAFVYTAAAYRLYNAYWRPALGEFSAQTFLPLVVYGFWALYSDDASEEQHRRAWLPLMLGFSGIIETHIITTELAALLAAAIVVFNWRKAFRRKELFLLLKGAAATVVLNLWFLVPFFTGMAGDYKCTQTGSIPEMGQHTVNFSGLFLFTSQDTSDIHLGLALLFGMALFLFCCVRWADLPRGLRRMGCFAAAGAAFTVWLCSVYDWSNIEQVAGKTAAHYLCSIQFPFRYLTLGTLLLCLCAVCALAVLQCKAPQTAAACGAVLVLLAAVGAALDLQPYVNAQYGKMTQGRASEVTTNEKTSGLEYLPTDFDLEQMYDTDVYFDDGVLLQSVQRDGLSFVIGAENPAGGPRAVDMPLTYYPGYRLANTGNMEATLLPSPTGRVRVVLPSGYAGQFSVWYMEPARWRAAELISLAFAVLLCIGAVRRHRAASNL